MYEVKALRSFEHGTARKRGERFPVATRLHAEMLEGKRLVEIVGKAGEEGAAGLPESFTAQLLERNAAEVVAWAGTVGDPAQLAEALSAEQAGKARKSVLAAIESALQPE